MIQLIPMERRPPNTTGLAIMLYVNTPEMGNSFYQTYLEPFGFPRTRYPNAPFYTDYHITLGYLEAVHFDDVQKLSDHLSSDLSNNINLNQVFFKFGMPTLLGLPRKPFIAILPENTDNFCNYNQIVFESLKSFKNGTYTLDTHTLPNYYLPHINLYGQVNKHIESKSVNTVLMSLRQKLQGITLPFSKIKIR